MNNAYLKKCQNQFKSRLSSLSRLQSSVSSETRRLELRSSKDELQDSVFWGNIDEFVTDVDAPLVI
jgi:hypothetical protein